MKEERNAHEKGGSGKGKKMEKEKEVKKERNTRPQGFKVALESEL